MDENERVQSGCASMLLKPSRVSVWCALAAMLAMGSCGRTQHSREPSGVGGSDSPMQGTGANQSGSGGVGASNGAGGNTGGSSASGGGSGGMNGGEQGLPWQIETELPEPGVQEADFGTGAIALYGDTAAFGTISGELGQVRVFAGDGSNWAEELNLTADAMSQLFGASVALFENTLLVGAPLDGDGSVGSAYVFSRVTEP